MKLQIVCQIYQTFGLVFVWIQDIVFIDIQLNLHFYSLLAFQIKIDNPKIEKHFFFYDNSLAFKWSLHNTVVIINKQSIQS